MKEGALNTIHVPRSKQRRDHPTNRLLQFLEGLVKTLMRA
ncbi:hypothetical protein LMG27177_03971 [Paraburkholderia fynbosensis]|uniref:Uncharacterized protein n=1 Tax=Paraburkholderia fynbosensis TaxID=1200993 RepID=A0A6J5GFE4_9BURK|nr:hypothetical protein LMG27177_03971 [Paraburkholderia fynbosensis]